MKLSKQLLGLLYQTVVNEMQRSKDRPAGYKEDLMKLEEIIGKELESLKEI
jgi:hypothetical protein